MKIPLFREEHWSESDVLKSFPKEAVFVLGLEQFVGEERGGKILWISGRENSMCRSTKSDKESSKV